MVAPVRQSFNLRAAEAFVRAEGSTMQRAWWGAAFGHGPVEVLLFELMPFQQDAGDWGGPVGPGCDPQLPASKVATMFVLRLLSGLALGEDVFEIGPRSLQALAARRDGSGRFAWPDGTLEGAELLAFAAYLDRMGAEGEALEAALAQAIATAQAHEGQDWWALGWGPLALGRHPEFAPWAERIEAEMPTAFAGSGHPLDHPAWASQAHLGQVGGLASWHEALVQRGRPSNDPLRAHLVQGLIDRQGPSGELVSPRGDAQVWATAFGARAILAR